MWLGLSEPSTHLQMENYGFGHYFPVQFLITSTTYFIARVSHETAGDVDEPAAGQHAQ
jgi:hypothetical protein